MVGTGRQDAGSGSVGVGERNVLAELGDVALDDGQAGLDVVVSASMGAIVGVTSGGTVVLRLIML
jgi:hypothetical protein